LGKATNTYDYVRKYFESNGFQLISDKYTSNKEKLNIKDNYGYYYFIRFDVFTRINKPDFVSILNPYTIQNIKLWCKLNNKPFELVSHTYEGSNKKLKWQCLHNDCGEIFEATWGFISQGGGCSFCAGIQVGLSNCLATKNPELAKQWHPTKNNDVTPYDVTCNSHKKVWWLCDKGHEWNSIIKNRNSLKAGCPECNKSKGEEKIKEIFDNNNISYFSQKSFDNLTGIKGGLLSYDFYLPNYNLLIEYQGEFHDGNTRRQSKNDIIRQQEHDKRKKQYAIDNNINLLEIWYWDYDNIEEILESELFKMCRTSIVQCSTKDMVSRL
jgi:hypothetical protein